MFIQLWMKHEVSRGSGEDAIRFVPYDQWKSVDWQKVWRVEGETIPTVRIEIT